MPTFESAVAAAASPRACMNCLDDVAELMKTPDHPRFQRAATAWAIASHLSEHLLRTAATTNSVLDRELADAQMVVVLGSNLPLEEREIFKRFCGLAESHIQLDAPWPSNSHKHQLAISHMLMWDPLRNLSYPQMMLEHAVASDDCPVIWFLPQAATVRDAPPPMFTEQAVHAWLRRYYARVKPLMLRDELVKMFRGHHVECTTSLWLTQTPLAPAPVELLETLPAPYNQI